MQLKGVREFSLWSKEVREFLFCNKGLLIFNSDTNTYVNVLLWKQKESEFSLWNKRVREFLLWD